MRRIQGIFLPILKENKSCINCKICLKVCPGYSLDLVKLNQEVFGSVPQNILLGNYVDCYIAYSTNTSLRYNSSSGGVVSALLIFALEKKFIDGAIVTSMSETNPLVPKTVIARTREEVLSASGSKYCPVPVNVALKDIPNRSSEKIALVGLPCHIQGIRKAEETLNYLKKAIVLHIGLFCGHTVSFNGTEFLLERMGVNQKVVSRLDYRKNGWWNDGLTVRLKDGSKRFFPLSVYWGSFFSRFFIPLHCLLCSDQTNELADISVGDAWLPALKGSSQGFSIVLVRTEIGERFLETAVHEGVIKTIKVGSQEVIKSQGSLLFKKRSLKARRFIFKSLGYEVPKVQTELLDPRIIDYLGAVLSYINFRVSKKALFLKILRYIPLPLLKVYSIINGAIS